MWKVHVSRRSKQGAMHQVPNLKYLTYVCDPKGCPSWLTEHQPWGRLMQRFVLRYKIQLGNPGGRVYLSV